MDESIREAAEKDLPEVVSLLNKYYECSYEFAPYTEESLRQFIREKNAFVLVAEGRQGISGIIAYFSHPRGTRIELLAVDAEKAQKDTADLLVREVELSTNADMIFTSVDAAGQEIDAWKRRGYTQENVWCHMIAQLKAVAPIPPSRCSAILRSLRKDEEAEMVEMANKSFGFQRLSLGCTKRWKEEHPGFSEEWIHVAEVGGKIVSIIVSLPDEEYNESFGSRRGYLGPAATLPGFTGMGLATALTRRAMNFLIEKGMDSVNLYTSETNNASIKLLQRSGFKMVSRWIEMSKHFHKTDG